MASAMRLAAAAGTAAEAVAQGRVMLGLMPLRSAALDACMVAFEGVVVWVMGYRAVRLRVGCCYRG